MIKIGLFELIDAFQKILKNLAADTRLEFTTDRMSVKDRISELVEVLEEKGSISFGELFIGSPDKGVVVVTFLAVLEMVKLCLIRIAQHTQSGTIRLFYV